VKHEETQLLLPDYLAGRLSGGENRLLEVHLADCEECAGFVSDLRPLPDLISRHGEALFDEHPEPVEIRRLRSGTAGPFSDRLQRHLAVCAPCGLQAVPLAEPSARPIVPEASLPSRSGHRLPRFLKAAGLIAAGLILGVMLALLVRQPIPARDGPIDLLVLQRTTRSGERVTRFQVRAGQEAVVIAIPIDPLDDRLDDERIVLHVATPAGRVIYGLEKSVSELKRAAGVSGVLPLLIDSPRLPPESYEVVMRVRGDSGELIAVFPFEIVGNSEK